MVTGTVKVRLIIFLYKFLNTCITNFNSTYDYAKKNNKYKRDIPNYKKCFFSQ